MSLIISRARLSDVDLIKQFIDDKIESLPKKHFLKPKSRIELFNHLSNGNPTSLIFNNNNLVAFAQARITNEKESTIGTVIVNSKFVSDLLIRHIISQIRTDNAIAKVSSDNRKSICLFERNGFHIRENRTYYDNSGYFYHIMERNLK